MRALEPYRGITALELLLSIAIMAIIAGLLVFGFSALRRTVAVNEAAETVMAVLSEARSRTLGSRDAASWGVHFEVDRVVLFKGPTFVDGTSTNEATSLADDVQLATITLAGGGADVLFDRLTGATSQAGTVTVEHKGDPVQNKIITILATGIVSL